MRLKVGVKASGRIVSWEGASLWILGVEPGAGEFPRTELHSHHAVQVSLALRGQFDLSGARRELRAVSGAAVAADCAHVFHLRSGVVAHLFIAPESRAGRALAQTFFAKESLRPLPADALGDLPVQLAAAFSRGGRVEPELIGLGRAIVARLSAQQAGDAPDRRIAKLIDWATHGLEEPLTLDAAAQHVGLSPGRLRHLFVAQTGLPFRVFLLWLRLTKAVERFAAGESLTDSAYAAGFSDSAHFSRTFRRMYGISAASLRVA